MAVGSLAGVLGAFLYTQFRNCLGLERTGLVSMTWQISCLILCVLSIWLTGSPFKPESLWKGPQEINETSTTSFWCHNSSLPATNNESSSALMTFNSSDSLNVTISVNTTNCNPSEEDHSRAITNSIIVFLVGITSSRIGKCLPIVEMCVA